MWTQEDHKFKVMLSYIVSSSPLWDTWHCLKNRKQEEEKGLHWHLEPPVWVCSCRTSKGRDWLTLCEFHFAIIIIVSVYTLVLLGVEPRAWCRPGSSALPLSYVLIPAPENLAQTFHTFRKNKGISMHFETSPRKSISKTQRIEQNTLWLPQNCYHIKKNIE